MTTGRSRLGPALLVGGYVVPVVATVALLARLGEPLLALALALIELSVSAAVHWAVRPRAAAPTASPRPTGQPVLGVPGQPAAPHSGRRGGWLVAGLVAAVALPALLAVLIRSG